MTMNLEAGKIAIEYRDGRVLQGIVLARYANTMSVAVKDADDAAIFTCVHGVWVSEDCEPVTIRSDWRGLAPRSADVAEEDCICSKELAARLLQSLFGGEAESDAGMTYEEPRYTPLVMRVV